MFFWIILQLKKVDKVILVASVVIVLHEIDGKELYKVIIIFIQVDDMTREYSAPF